MYSHGAHLSTSYLLHLPYRQREATFRTQYSPGCLQHAWCDFQVCKLRKCHAGKSGWVSEKVRRKCTHAAANTHMGTCSVSLSAQWMHLLSPTWITGAAAAGRWGDNLKCPWGEVTGMAESHVVPSISYKICLQGCTTVHSLHSLSKCLAAHQPLHLPPLSLSCLRWLRAVRLWILSESPGVALLSANKSNSGLGNHS